MTNELIREKLELVERDSVLQNLIAQANARYILLNTSESRENFPPYTIRDDKLNILALYYINLGCSFVENQSFNEAIGPLEKGAALLEFVHIAEDNRGVTSSYYGLLAAMAYYVSFQYSKSFIMIRKVETNSIIARLIYLFLSRSFVVLTTEINLFLVDQAYTDDYLSENDTKIDAETKIYEITIAKALDGFIKYFYSGNDKLLFQAKALLRSLQEIAELQSDPGIWWVIRLLFLISEGFGEASLWNVLSKHFDITDDQVQGYIKALVYNSPRGIYELFITQRRSLVKVLNQEKGCIVSIPTSSGKTRIAELAILKCMIDAPDSKVLYIAPFRSLAFEVENALEPILENANITVSHLYGGSLYSKLDEKIVDDSDVIIATPEKAKAIFRGNDELISQVKLIIIDEGHLLGPNKRFIVNEMFYEELRYYMEQNEGRFLVLSAVLPNSEELSNWLTQSDNTVFKDLWRPSDERLGILEWTGSHVNLNWVSQDDERPSFNNRFILSEPLPLIGRQRKVRYHPGSKNDAVAATAYKFRTFGSVLIFVGLKDSVFVMAGSYLRCLANPLEEHDWKNKSDWRAFEMACIETYGEDNNLWLNYAQKGILCHNADLHADVRLPLERLMRSDKPLVIIATSTLGQGVNLGVSTVIFSTLYQAGTLITPRDFWNIAGRAGRAFVDHEGKILVAMETLGFTRRQVINRTKTIKDAYFDKGKIDFANSGILSLIVVLKQTAEENDIDFDLMLELITENKTEDIGEKAGDVDEVLDWIDDTLLTLLSLHTTDDEVDLSWVEDFFKKSLASIQAVREEDISSDQVVRFFHSRLEGIVAKVGEDRNTWNSIVKSGLPLNTDLMIEDKLDEIIVLVQSHFEDEIDTKIALVKALEELLEDLPVLVEDDETFDSPDKDRIRERWLNGEALSGIFQLKNAATIITKSYTFKLPWILNGIGKKFRNLEMEAEAQTVEELSVLLESGLPTLKMVKIYQAGIRSRTSAKELGLIFDDEFWDKTVNDYKRQLISEVDWYKVLCSPTTGEWLDLLKNNSARKEIKLKTVSDFTFGKVHERTEVLIARLINKVQYLISPDLRVIEDVSASAIDFSSVNGVPGIEFIYSFKEEIWKISVKNPYVMLTE